MAVDHIPFNRNGLCGAACAQMVLHAWGLIESTSGRQEELWSSIKAHTHGKSKKPCSGLVPEVFPKMMREKCADQQRVFCWCSYPDAMKETLEAYCEFQGTQVQITLSEHDDEDAANGVIRNCLERGGLPIVLVNSGKHWVVVSEWFSGTDPSLQLLDPAADVPSIQSIGDWNVFYMSAVDCGRYDDKYVVLEVDHDA